MMPAQEPSSDRVAKLAASPFHERIPHPAGATLDGSAVIAMFRTNQIRADDTMYVLVTEDDGRVTTSWQSDECDACDNNGEYRPGRGTPAGTAQTERAATNCVHANVASAAFHLDSTGRCSDCGGWAIEANELAHPRVPGAVALVEEYCRTAVLSGLCNTPFFGSRSSPASRSPLSRAVPERKRSGIRSTSG